MPQTAIPRLESAGTAAAARLAGPTPSFDAAAASDAGRSRGHNEDSWCIDPATALLAVADGMGGYNAGDVASSLAVESIAACLREDDAAPQGCGDDLDLLARGVAAANAAILALAARRPECLGMGTTVALARALGARLTYAHVGDSRVYLMRGERLARLTRDHSVGQAMADAGISDAAQLRRAVLRGVLTRALGVERTVQPDFGVVELEAGDVLLLCTDGLTDLVSDDAIAACLRQGNGAAGRAEALVQAALQAGGSDNITALVALPAQAAAAHS
jgi:protein phosphatase